ncbi:MAG TPA: serine hydrolase domain-containing protein [Actinophytocola sp.]|uniref:serine hydrolase domain-containing protein n=1 Tax=Actinophytocola sp. TaxID=1872138 RepID=UPI002DB72990|nr:serine hydrolase domain-containing protein [Actinophytocola sp.]HEU5475536.1 serine hydrolase domain-containing protein [Actinophytocola sp.]
MTTLRSLLESYAGSVPGAVGLVGRGDHVEVAAVGEVEQDSIFRLASAAKPITAAAVMMLVEAGLVGLADPVDPWLPELAEPRVVRTPESPLDDTVPARRAITVRDLLDFRAGYGFTDFELPAVAALFERVQDIYDPKIVGPVDEWMAELSRIPMLHQPGEAWLYNTCSDLQGVLIARVSGQSLPDFLAERIFQPLGMVDTAFHVPQEKRDRFTTQYRNGPDGLTAVDGPDGLWSRPPSFPAGAGGLVSTAADCHRFGRMLLAGGQHLLSERSVRQMMTDQLTAAQRAASAAFLDGQGWGFGGAVDVEPTEPWNVPGRYGWSGGTGTSLHVVPDTGTVTVLLTQVELDSPTPPEVMRAFWRYSAVT